MSKQTERVHMVCSKLFSLGRGVQTQVCFSLKVDSFSYLSPERFVTLDCQQLLGPAWWDMHSHTKGSLFTACWLCSKSKCHRFTSWLESPAAKGYVNLSCVKDLFQYTWSPKTYHIVESIAQILGFARFEFISWLFQVLGGRCWASSLTSLSLNPFIIEIPDWLRNEIMCMKALHSTLNHLNTTFYEYQIIKSQLYRRPQALIWSPYLWTTLFTLESTYSSLWSLLILCRI